MTTKLSRERALTAALDHLHTGATALARFASKTPADADVSIEARPSSAPAAAPRRPRPTSRRHALTAVGALVLATFGCVTLVRSVARGRPGRTQLRRLLRRRAAHRSRIRQHAARGRRRHRRQPGRPRLLARRLRRRRVLDRQRQVLRLDRRPHARTQPIVGMAADPDRARLLARRLRRRRVRLRRRRVPRLHRRGVARRADRRDPPDDATAAATGSSPPTAASSRTATPASTARPCASTSRARSSAPRPARAATATGSSEPTAACSPSATRASTARRTIASARGRDRGRAERRTATGSPTPTAASAASARASAGQRLRSIDGSAPHPNTVGIAASAARRLLAGAGSRRRGSVARRRPVPRVHACARVRSGRRLPRGEPGRHVPRRLPVRPVDVEQRGAARRVAPTSSAPTRPRSRPPTRTSSRWRCSRRAARRRGADAAPDSRSRTTSSGVRGAGIVRDSDLPGAP